MESERTKTKGGSHRPSYFPTSTPPPSGHTSHHHGRPIVKGRFLTWRNIINLGRFFDMERFWHLVWANLSSCKFSLFLFLRHQKQEPRVSNIILTIGIILGSRYREPFRILGPSSWPTYRSTGLRMGLQISRRPYIQNLPLHKVQQKMGEKKIEKMDRLVSNFHQWEVVILTCW
jgi:hypothetical protein